MVRSKISKITKWLKVNRNAAFLMLLLAIVFFGNKAREHAYYQVPIPGESLDEYSFGWLGLSLIQQRYPIAWSGISAYKNHDFQKIEVDDIFLTDRGRPLLSIDKPWFDHPPLFGLIIGSYAHLKGVREFGEASLVILRRPMLKIAIVTTVLIFILASVLYGKAVGLLSAMIYSVSPVYLFSSRMVLAENGFTPIFLLVVILTVAYHKKGKPYELLIANLLASVSVLFKLSAVSIFLYLFIFEGLFLKKEKIKFLLVSLISLALPIIIFTFYGKYYDWGVFLDVLQYNSNRFFGAGSEILYSAVTKSTVTKGFGDGWVIAGWISLFITAHQAKYRKKPEELPLIAFYSYFFVFLFFGSEAYGHYRIPFYPFLSIFTALIMYEIFLRENILSFLLLLLLPIGTTLHRLLGIEGFQNIIGVFRLMVLFVFLLFLLRYWKKRNPIVVKSFMMFVLVVAVFISIKEIYMYDFVHWITAN